LFAKSTNPQKKASSLEFNKLGIAQLIPLSLNALLTSELLN
jgi:hypothetical protein